MTKKPAFALASAALLAGIGAAVGGRSQDTPPHPSARIDPTIQKIVSEVSEERIGAVLRKLESFETRNTFSDPNQPGRGIGAARQWILDEMASYSPRLQVRFDTHTIPKGGRVWRDVEVRNVVAVSPGKTAQARWIVVAGHYDSLNLKLSEELRADRARAAEAPAPGVADDGSGTAATMECARVLSRYEFDATLVFVAFAGEEQGLLGARAMAGKLRESGQAVEALLNNDIIGTDTSGNGAVDNRRVLVFSEDPNDSPSRQLARFIKRISERYYPEMQVDTIFRHDRFGRGGDHTPFNQEGYAAVRFTTPNENFAHQHSATDTVANSSIPYAARVTRVNAAAAAALALAPRRPATGAPRPTEDLDPGAAAERRRRGPGLGRGSGYDAVLRWDQPDPEPDLAGFAVVVRATSAADWEREIWVGNVREFTMKDTPIDQLVFGVKAVDRDGHESLVSAYTTAPRRSYR